MPNGAGHLAGRWGEPENGEHTRVCTAAGVGMNRNHGAVLRGPVAGAGSQDKALQLERE